VKIVTVIPVRWGSTRLPAKAVREIAGKPLVRWVVENAMRARRPDRLVVAADDQRIIDAIDGLGVEGVMTRSDHVSGTDRCAEAVAGMGAGVVINVQGDEPLIDPGLIDRLADVLAGSDRWDMATAAAAVGSREELADPSVVKVVRDAEGGALYFSRSVIPHEREGAAAKGPPLHWRHIGVYGYRAEFLERLVREPACATEQAEKLEQLRALHIGGRILVLETDDQGIGVDTAEDAERVEQILLKRQEQA